jgi:hypothetical protein
VRAHVADACDPAVAITNDRTPGGADAGGAYPIGDTTVVFAARDAEGHSATCTTHVVVQDTRPPDLSCPAVVLAECSGGGSARVDVRAHASDACDAAPGVTNDRTGSGGDATGVYPLGDTLVRFDATDAAGHAATCTTRVTVRDTQAPLVVAQPDTSCLWPPNHLLVRFRMGEHVRLVVQDACSDAAGVSARFTGVTVNEPDDGNGDGSTSPDFVVRDDEVFLRSERDGRGDGRVYRVTLSVTDPSGNASETSFDVRVPSGGNSRGSNSPDGCKALPLDRFVSDRDAGL